mmetsp:Transcript_24163/g.35808  ORF Transcript_24163/g.35808 Transcript_24163/m.35808 type:complete len:106 (+) Transcript_24163:278-595(+)
MIRHNVMTIMVVGTVLPLFGGTVPVIANHWSICVAFPSVPPKTRQHGSVLKVMRCFKIFLARIQVIQVSFQNLFAIICFGQLTITLRKLWFLSTDGPGESQKGTE